MSPETKPNKQGGEIRISADKFAAAVDKITSDSEFRQQLEQRPIETLASIGIELDERAREKLQGKKLSELLDEGPTGGGEGVEEISAVLPTMAVRAAAAVANATAIPD